VLTIQMKKRTIRSPCWVRGQVSYIYDHIIIICSSAVKSVVSQSIPVQWLESFAIILIHSLRIRGEEYRQHFERRIISSYCPMQRQETNKRKNKVEMLVSMRSSRSRVYGGNYAAGMYAHENLHVCVHHTSIHTCICVFGTQIYIHSIKTSRIRI
jgi:hypothetical protein